MQIIRVDGTKYWIEQVEYVVHSWILYLFYLCNVRYVKCMGLYIVRGNEVRFRPQGADYSPFHSVPWNYDKYCTLICTLLSLRPRP